MEFAASDWGSSFSLLQSLQMQLNCKIIWKILPLLYILLFLEYIFIY